MTRIRFSITREHLEHDDPDVRRLAKAADSACRDFIAALARYEEERELVVDDDIETTGAGQAPVPPDGDEARSDLAPAAAPVPARRTRTGEHALRKQRTAAIRAWGLDNGFHLTGTGRFPQALIDAYEAAHPQEAHGE